MAAGGVGVWLPRGKAGAVCLSIDDVHPGTSRDGYDGGGDLGAGALGHLERLLESFPRLRATLFVTPDWRALSVVPTRRRLERVPWLRDLFYLAPLRPAGTLALPRHREFARYLRDLPRTEVAMHGLRHVHRGRRLTVEFQRQSRRRCVRMLLRARRLFAGAGLPLVPGLQPPGWELPRNLRLALADAGFAFVASGRDLTTPIGVAATTAGSGLRGAPLILPQTLQPGSIVHLPVNFQATSAPQRAFEILDAGGLVSIKAHVAGDLLGYRMLDGLDAAYRDRLTALFEGIDTRYGDAVWWTSMAEVAGRVRASDPGGEEGG